MPRKEVGLVFLAIAPWIALCMLSFSNELSELIDECETALGYLFA